MSGPTAKIWRSPLTLISVALALIVIAGFTIGLRRKGPLPVVSAIATTSLPISETTQLRDATQPAEPQPPADAQPSVNPTFLILAWMETTPPGARIVRVSDGHVLGYTNEIVEFHQSNEPVQIRLEKDGYIPVTREVSAYADSELKIELKAIPKKRAAATKKSNGK